MTAFQRKKKCSVKDNIPHNIRQSKAGMDLLVSELVGAIHKFFIEKSR